MSTVRKKTPTPVSSARKPVKGRDSPGKKSAVKKPVRKITHDLDREFFERQDLIDVSDAASEREAMRKMRKNRQGKVKDSELSVYSSDMLVPGKKEIFGSDAPVLFDKKDRVSKKKKKHIVDKSLVPEVYIAEKVEQKVKEAGDDNAAVEGAVTLKAAEAKAVRKGIDAISDIHRRKRTRIPQDDTKSVPEAEMFETYDPFAKTQKPKPAGNTRPIDKRDAATRHERNRLMQKQRIKREYAKAVRSKEGAKATAEYARKATQKATAIAHKIEEFVRAHAVTIAIIGAVVALFIMIATMLSSCGAMFGSGISGVMAGSYNSVPTEIDKADEAFTLRELELQNEIDEIETDYPDYDEYDYNLEEIGHDPYVLINYLSAIYVDIDAVAADAEIESLFDEMYELTLTPRDEIRTRIVEDPDTGEEVEEEYTVHILGVELTRKELIDIVEERLIGNEDASILYAGYKATHGALHRYYTPLDVDWYSLISSYYGYRKNPITEMNEFHRGVDISVVEGTEVYAAQNGTVIETGFDEEFGNYIVISNADGYVSKYAHLASMEVMAGQPIQHGHLIGKTGSTGAVLGSHLHIECLYNGEYYNPLFYFENGNGSIYGTTDPVGGGSGDVAALIAEAERYLDYPYVWGGSNPGTSFDCSGFVCWALTNSGYYDMPRTTAQGIYNKCTPVSAGSAQPGDLIFFTKTYNSGNPVTHVGIYVGGGQMIHCGDPIKYSSITTPYWQEHFYGFGRLDTGGGP